MQITIDTIEATFWKGLAMAYRERIENGDALKDADEFVRNAAVQRVDKFIAKLAKVANGGEEGVRL